MAEGHSTSGREKEGKKEKTGGNSGIRNYTPCCPWSHGLRTKKLLVSMAVLPAPVRFPNQRPLAPSVASITSVANDMGDNEMILGVVHRSPGFLVQPGNVPFKEIFTR